MARSGTFEGGGIAGCLLTVFAFVVSAAAQEAPPTQPYSQECQKGGDALVAESRLPNVAAALAKGKSLRILTIGASSALGRSTRGGYTRLIENILERAVKGIDVVMINHGVSGELAADAAVRIKNEVALDRPDLVLWQVGTNDALAYIALDSIKQTVIDTIDWLRAHKVDVILVGLQRVDRMRRDEHYNAVRDALREIAADENVIIVRRDEAMELINQAKTDGGAPLPDEFEQTDIGYTCLAQYVARAITLGVFGKTLRSGGRARSDEKPQ